MVVEIASRESGGRTVSDDGKSEGSSGGGARGRRQVDLCGSPGRDGARAAPHVGRMDDAPLQRGPPKGGGGAVVRGSSGPLHRTDLARGGAAARAGHGRGPGDRAAVAGRAGELLSPGR